MSKLYISPGKPSDGAKSLKEKLNAHYVKTEGSTYSPKNEHLIVNWGNSQKMPWYKNGINILNKPDKVAVAVNKTATFQKLRAANLSVPDFTTDINVARGWFNGASSLKVVCRTKINASGGDGIVIAKTSEEVVQAPLYTKYQKKQNEYRIHVLKDIIIDFAEKKKSTSWNVEQKGEIDPYIRSHDRGWVFCREGVNPPPKVLDLAKKSIKALELDFGAVDIIFSDAGDGVAYALEVNTAPGLEPGGTTLERYSAALKNLSENKAIKPAIVIPANANLNNTPPPAQVVQQITQAVPVPAAVVAVQTPIKKVTNSTRKVYKIADLSDIEVTEENGKVTIRGKVGGYKIKALEVSGNVSFWAKEE